jgi:hypothetical protein
LLPGVNYPVMFCILLTVIMSEIHGKSVDPNRVKFKVKIPDLETYTINRVTNAFNLRWDGYVEKSYSHDGASATA